MNASPFDIGLYRQHLDHLQGEWEAALEALGADVAVLPAGIAAMYFQDDQAPPFHPNPHFARWLPGRDCEGSVLVVRPGAPAKLHFLGGDDYWHMPPTLPEWAADNLDVARHTDADDLASAISRELAGCKRPVLAGPADALDLNLRPHDVNPKEFTARLHYARAYKTDFELDRMRAASAAGAAGHIAARDAFLGGGSEFEIQLAFLAGSSQVTSELPYPSIVALGEHAGILHYQHYDRGRPNDTRSFLIDAGARADGYHSDITRTYTATSGDDFDELVQALDEKQQAMVAQVRPGMTYVDLHVRMHQEVADLLVRFDFVRCSAEAAFDLKLTDAFFPHGLGHLLGLQTHDVGGQFGAPDGTVTEPPERFPSLRLTRNIEPGQVFTVEPGLYFIPMLLDAIEERDAVNWVKVESFLRCGGIRIEDNVAVEADGVENLTRPAFAALEEAAS
ncbi:MAG: Xaa-Pro dipeptidase [Gammaproteobacteria bacterium]|nr:Xaa-Pro dipeptidase [Gammaproteobacteria bacterium]